MTQRVLFVALALVVGGGQAAAAQRERTMRFQDLDRDNNGRITRDEWRGNDRSFERHDWNGDGVLAGDEVRIGTSRDGQVRDDVDDRDARFDDLDVNRDNRVTRDEWRDARAAFDRLDENRDGRLTRAEMAVAIDDDAERFSILDVDRNGVISRGEWRGSAASFTRLDRNRDGRLSSQEYEVDDPSRTVTTDDDRLYRPQGQATGQATTRNPSTETRSYRAGYDRGLADGRNAGREDRERNQGWDLEGQRELETADYGFSDSLGSRTEYQAGYRAAFRLGYREGYGPR
jgi:Ca2+-binding EF-hand superfamily protein